MHGVDVQRKLRLAVGAVKDHASIGKAMIYSNHQGRDLSSIQVAVVRATGHDSTGPIDDKHMHEILFLVSNSPGSIHFLAERISRRLGKTRDNLVALKTLSLIHRLLRGGNRCFEQQLRSAHASGHLQMTSTRCSFLIRNRNNNNISVSFVHKYAAYLEERIGWVMNQAGKLEPVMPQGDLEFRCYDGKSIDMVFRKLPKCQVFIDRVLDYSPIFNVLPSSDHSILLAQAAMINTLKESFQVYKTYCEGVAALVNMFFDLTRPARDMACQILKRASKQSQDLHGLYETCKRIIENKNLDYPAVQIISMDHVMALGQFPTCIPTSHSPSVPSNNCSTIPPPILDSITKSTKLETAMTSIEDDHVKVVGNFSWSSTLFSCTLETKISKVWVVFED